MKLKKLLALCILFLIPVSAFSMADVSLYGGSTVSGKTGDKADFKPGDIRYGGNIHLNTDFLVFFKAGIGGFYQAETVSYKGDWSLDRKTAGIDAFLQADLPLIPVSPFIHGNAAAWNKISGGGDSAEDYFKTYGAGGGLFFTILPVPGIVKLQIFGEYMYRFGKEDGINSTGHQVNLGVRADLF